MDAEKRKALVFLAVCGVFIGGILLFFRDNKPPGKITWQRLESLKTAISDYSEKHGRAPETLEDLGLPPAALEDHTGERFHFSVSENTVTLISYGADKKPGGAVFNRDFEIVFPLE